LANDKKDLTSTAASKRQQRKIEQQRVERRKRLLMIVGGVVAVAIVAVLVLIIVNNRDDSSNLPDVQAAAAPDASIPVNGMSIGDPNAPVTIVEYGDYQCPFCAEFNKDAMPPLLADYISTGKVQLTFVPFSFLGDESLAAAEAAFCANDQGKFWAMHETIYANHNGENIGNLSASRLREMAEKSGLDMDQYDVCIDAGTHKGDVQNSSATARTAGIASTPSFVINNGDPIGYASWDDFKAEIDDALGNV
jgi:protein-disulfide isomerase